MPLSSPENPRILFLYSDTGGGHRSAAEAIIEALNLAYGDRIATKMVDAFREYAPLPLTKVPELYTHLVRVPQAWGFGYHLSNGQRRAKLFTASTWPYVRRNTRKLIAQNPSDLIVSVHPLVIAPALRALKSMSEGRPPFITVVTDLVSTHALWYHPRTDLCLVPTNAAYQKALESGLQPRQVNVVGLPVAHRFCQPRGDKKELRDRLGWPKDLPVILMVGGGEGMGPLREIARAIGAANLPTTLVVITGRNKELKSRLESHHWSQPTFIYGFVHNMPDFMHAADMIVTKAGPGTISESLNAGLPMVLYSRLPGQEEGNVTFVTTNGAGVWAPEPKQIVRAVQEWIERPELHQAAAECSQSLARPDASRKIARLLAKRLGIE